MWEFMAKYADNFWVATDYAFEVFTVIMAWAITLGAAWFVFIVIVAIGEIIRDKIREISWGYKTNGKEE